MKAITKAVFEARLTAYELEVGGAGEFVGGGGVAPSALSQLLRPTSSPASLTDLWISTTRWPRPRHGRSTHFARGWW